MVLRGASGPRGLLGGVLDRGFGDDPVMRRRGVGGGIRAALEAMEGIGDTGAGAGAGAPLLREGVRPRDAGTSGGPEAGQEGEKAAKIARLEEEVAKLRNENRRWQEVRCPACVPPPGHAGLADSIPLRCFSSLAFWRAMLLSTERQGPLLSFCRA